MDPVTAELIDTNDDLLSSDPTLLPFWPGQQAAGLARPLDIGWTWSLVDQPHHQVCSALTSNSLAASFATGGRLQTLLGQPPSSWTLQQWVAGDLDDDGVLTTSDVQLLSQIVAGQPN